MPDAHTRTRTTRRIAADPTSTALLLTGPAALQLWPGVRKVGVADGLALVETELPSTATAEVVVRALPPRRTPTAFVTRFTWSGPGLPGTSGELRLTYAPGDGTPATLAELVLDSEAADTELDGPTLRTLADGFLENLSRAAEERNRAA